MPEGHEQEGDLRMRDRAQEPLPARHLERLDARVRRRERDRASVEACDRAAVELRQQVRDVGGDEIDERRGGVERLVVGERAARDHRLGGERDVAMPRLRERSRVGRDVRRGLLLHRLALLLARAETGCAAPMCVPGAMAATSAASTRMKPADAARAPGGATNTTTGVRASIIRETIVRVESTRPPGVRSTNTTAAAPRASARSIAPTMNSAETGWMMASTSATTMTGWC